PYSASLVFFALALLSKTQVVFLPFVLLLYGWWRNKKSAGTKTNQDVRSDAIRSWPFFAIAIFLRLVTMWFQSRGIGEEEIVIGSLPRRFVNAAMAIWWYAAHLFAPVRLMAIYANWRFDFPRILDWLPLIGLIAILDGLLSLRERRSGG